MPWLRLQCGLMNTILVRHLSNPSGMPTAMNLPQLIRRKQRATVLLCAAFFAILAISSAIMLLDDSHDCMGEDCPICLAIQQAKDNLTSFGMAEAPSSALHWAFEPPLVRHLPPAVFLTAFQASLVVLKVRQNK